MSGTFARHTGHAIERIRFSTLTSGKSSSLDCECGASFEAMPDRAFPDPHDPLVRLYQAHRTSAKAGPAKVSGEAWRALPIQPGPEYVLEADEVRFIRGRMSFGSEDLTRSNYVFPVSIAVFLPQTTGERVSLAL